MPRGLVTVAIWLGWFALLIIGSLALAGAICFIGGWRGIAAYGFALTWTGIAVAVIGALVEWLLLPILLAALLTRRRQEQAESRQPARGRSPGIAAFIAAGLTSFALGRLLIAIS